MNKVASVVAMVSLAVLFLAAGCSKRVHYTNVFGEYSLTDAEVQYEELFQMKPSQFHEFLSFKDGWWIVDVKKMRAMGIDVPTLCERYCRIQHIKVPFPLLIDFDVLQGQV